MVKDTLSDIAISTFIIIIFVSCYVYIQYKDWKDEAAEDKQICVETHQKLNRSELQIVCGKLASI